MPLPQPADRELMHTRDIKLQGFRRADGLMDVEAHLTDTKAFDFSNPDRGAIASGVPLHEMWVRMTINDRLEITACEAVTDHGPYINCVGGAASFAKLVGLRIRPGFLKAANERVGGVLGCTHLREMLQQIGTVALQTIWPVKSRRDAETLEAAKARGEQPMSKTDGTEGMINSCFAYAADGENVRKRWPHRYTGGQAVAETPVVG
jgi:hypothetical protein